MDAVREQILGTEILSLHGRIKTLEAQLAAQREIVAADDAYRVKVIAIAQLSLEDAFSECQEADWAWRECEQAREAAEQLDKETTNAT